MRKPKTPLRYPGGKSRLAKRIVDLMPQDMESYYEGFLGGGSVALEVTRRFPGCSVHVNDLFFPLYVFWKTLRDYPGALQERLLEMKEEEDRRAMFDRCKEHIKSMDHHTVEGACCWYAVNKCGFSGLVSGYSPQAWTQNFSVKCIEELSGISNEIQNWTITNKDYANWDVSEVVYLDPPYEINASLYGNRGEMHSGFSHEDFIELMEGDLNSGTKLLISYNAEMGERFSNKWKKIYFDHTYTMRSTGEYMEKQKQRQELILINKEQT